MTLSCFIIDDEPLALGLIESYVRKTPFLALAGKFLLLSWPAPGRGADDGCPLYGRDAEGIRRELRALGMEPDVGLTNFFRKQTDRPFLREELYAFRRVAPARSPSGENE